jgi:hypothetical protein
VATSHLAHQFLDTAEFAPLAFVCRTDFAPSAVVFDAAMRKR